MPLNIMCSNTCATPEVPSTSSIEPTRTHSMCATVGARRSGLTMSVRPLASVNSCACAAAAGLSALAVVEGLAVGSVWAEALLNAQNAVKAVTASIARHEGIDGTDVFDKFDLRKSKGMGRRCIIMVVKKFT